MPLVPTAKVFMYTLAIKVNLKEGLITIGFMFREQVFLLLCRIWLESAAAVSRQAESVLLLLEWRRRRTHACPPPKDSKYILHRFGHPVQKLLT